MTTKAKPKPQKNQQKTKKKAPARKAAPQGDRRPAKGGERPSKPGARPSKPGSRPAYGANDRRPPKSGDRSQKKSPDRATPAGDDRRPAKDGDRPERSGRGRPFKVDPKDNAYNMRVEQIRIRLNEMRQYKKILEEEGLKPDQDDKRIETELIRRLLWLEKQHARPTPQASDGTEDTDAPAPEPKKKPTRRGKERVR